MASPGHLEAGVGAWGPGPRQTQWSSGAPRFCRGPLLQEREVRASPQAHLHEHLRVI